MALYVTQKDWLNLVSKIVLLRDRLLFEILYTTGCSESELISLKVNDIDFKTLKLNIGDRKINLPRKISSLLSSHISTESLSKSSFLFSSRQSSNLTAKRVQQIVKETSFLLIGISLKPIDIRYTHIYHALLRNVSIISLQKKTGLSFQRISQIIEDISKHSGSELDFGYEL